MFSKQYHRHFLRLNYQRVDNLRQETNLALNAIAQVLNDHQGSILVVIQARRLRDRGVYRTFLHLRRGYYLRSTVVD